MTALTWDNDGATGCINTRRPLTHSLDLTEEGLAMEATQCQGAEPQYRTNGWDKRKRRETVCIVEDCGTARRITRGYCPKHYGRWLRHGSVADPIQGENRFWSYVDVGDCWHWTGPVDGDGYGMTHLPGGRSIRAHRYVWELLVGEVPRGLQLDHQCRNRRCANPDHLEPVTQLVNMERGHGIGARNRRKTHCKQRHEFTPENTIRVGPEGRQRRCRTCKNDDMRERRANRSGRRVA